MNSSVDTEKDSQREKKTYTAFISYSHTDMATARWLQSRLESFELPPELVGSVTKVGKVPANLKPVFRDTDEFSAGPSVSASIREALESSKALVVVCSPASRNSTWVDDEVKHFVELGRADRIFALLVDGDPATAPQECFPPSLLASLDGDVPLAADVRKGGLGEGKVKALSKIVAGITGLPLDNLIQREQRATKRRLVMRLGAAAALSLALIAAMLFFSLFRIEGEKAERRLAASKENLTLQLERIETFQNDINATEAHIRLTMEGANAEISRFSGEIGNDPDIRISEARLYKIFGDLEYRFGNILAQRKLLEKAQTLLGSVAWDYPNEDLRELILEVDVGLAGVLDQLGDGQGALALSTKSYERATDLLREEPNNTDWQKYKVRAASNIGTYHEQRASTLEANNWFSQGAQYDSSQPALNGDLAELAIVVAGSYRRFGNTEVQLGRPERADQVYKRAIAKLEAVLAMSEPVHTRPATRELAFVQMRQGFLEASRDRSVSADSWIVKSLATFNKSLSLDPHDRDAMSGKAIALTYMAEISARTDEWERSKDLHAQALLIFEDVNQSDYKNEYNQLQMARTLINLGRANSELADRAPEESGKYLNQANTNYARAEGVISALLETDPENVSKTLELGRVIYGRALILMRQGDDGMLGKHQKAWVEMDRAVTLRRSVLENDPGNEMKAQDLEYAKRWKAFIATRCGDECSDQSN